MMGLTRVIKLFFPELVRETVLVPLKDLSEEMNLSESNAADKAQRHYTKSIENLNKPLAMEMSSKPSVEDAVSNEFKNADPSELANAMKVLGKDNLMKEVESRVHVRS